MGIGSRADQYAVTVTVDGRAIGTFDTFSGGEVDSEETKYRPGGMAAQVSLGGPVNVGNVTVGRLYDGVRDDELVPWLRSRIGKGAATVTRQPLDTDGNVFGRPWVYTGVLKMLTVPDHDSNSADAAMLELEVSSSAVA